MARNANNAEVSLPSCGPHSQLPVAHNSVPLRPSFEIRDRFEVQNSISLRNNNSFLPNPPKLDKKQSSGESSNADRWFEHSNRNIDTGAGESLMNSDPPFFLRPSPSSETPSRVDHEQMCALPREELMDAHVGSSDSEDFRSVIDDLTIENKKLKRRLRKYEKLHDAHLQSDKLFEVRMHGLPAQKRRELESLLRKFAVSLGTPPRTLAGDALKPFTASVGKQAAGSSLTSTRVTDSAYASMSGHDASALSGPGSMSWRGPTQAISHQQQQRNVKSYLHEIPAGLLPRSSATMTEKVRRKLVVRRLEQLFAGKGAAKEGHQHPLQQEEVAQSAALADRIAIEFDGRPAVAEGAREAQIVPTERSVSCDDGAQGLVSDAMEEDVDGTDGPQQRPTRPLDLDPRRAQVPADNIEYMRHLGFSPPHTGSTSLADDHGWVYLNVLTNMAQLHDINVTPAFVRKAIAEISKKLELSSDGRKARWKGGRSLTRTSSDGSEAQNSESSPKHLEKAENVNVPGDDHNDKSTEGTWKFQPNVQTIQRLAYTPLFSHREESTDESSPEANTSGWSSPSAEDGPAMSAKQIASIRKRQSDDGPLIFYINANFCTDLSGDRTRQSTSNSTLYQRVCEQPVGFAAQQPTAAAEQFVGVAECKGPLSMPANTSADMDVDQTSSDGDALTNYGSSSLEASPYQGAQDLMDLEASGVGGVLPSDNFEINVKSKRKPSSGTVSPAMLVYRKNMYSRHMADMLSGQTKDPASLESASRRTFNEEIVSTEYRDIPSSALPPASYYPAFSSPDEDDDFEDSDTNSESSECPTGVERSLQARATQLMNWPTTESEKSSKVDSESEVEEEDSEESIDMLADARKVDPLTVRAREREYDGSMADRLAEEIPAGSSAATAGGGSGFNSPSLAHAGSAQQKRAEMAPPSLKRARIDESVAIRIELPKSQRLR